MYQRRVAEKPDSSETLIPGRPVVFLWKEGWDERTPILAEVFKFLDISDQSPCFFPYFSEDIWEVFPLISEYRELYSHVYLLFSKGDCNKEIHSRIAQKLPDGMSYEIYEIDETDKGRFFRRTSSWDLAGERARVHSH